jgi:adenylosuccinate lyase
MSAIWSRQAKYQRWLEVELAVCRAWAEEGVIPVEDWETIRARASFDLARCDELEQETRHDLLAFVRSVSETIGPPAARWVHFGLTSYDVIDTALGMMLRDSCDVLTASLSGLVGEITGLMVRHGQHPCIGRTHGIHAEPITFGHKLEGWTREIERSRSRLTAARAEVAVGKVSGAVGIHAHVSPQVEARICKALGLEPDPASTQIVSRDRHAHLLSTLAVLAASLERIATELRNLQRTEILEVQEAFESGQAGSSAMPHKRNPWNSETICGLARVVRGNALAMLESVATWHERDLTNSSVERIVLPDTFHLVHFMIERLRRILSGLKVFPEAMQRNLRLMGDLVFSEHLMLALVRAGMSREDAYKVAQRAAAMAWEGADFRRCVTEDPEVGTLLGPEGLEEIFSLEHHLRYAPRVQKSSDGKG